MQNTQVDLSCTYPEEHLNRMMMDFWGSDRFFHLVKEKHVELVQEAREQNEFPNTIHLKFEDGFID